LASGMGVGGGGGGGGEAAAVSAPAPAEEAGKDAEDGNDWTLKAKLIAVAVLGATALGVFLHSYFRHAAAQGGGGLVSMCEERARMLQDQFAVSVNHVHALATLVATFHYEKHPPALDHIHLCAAARHLHSAGGQSWRE
jgi:arabidopsis histidine kinase 2/3/4 (cytokinin receptor)